ncbi:MAG: hypothetical protein II984_05960 [Clostridia bacterium]|nr:hypothetical protein [Clostridia bacterium]
MSEAERKKRLSYKEKRKKWIIAQSVILAVLAVLLVAFTVIYYQLNKEYYINYTESSEIDYMVQLKPNDYYETEWLGKDQAYIASLVESILAEFKYEMNMEAHDVDYKYSYSIDAKLQIVDNDTQKLILDKFYAIKDKQEATMSSNSKLEIKELVSIDYDIYNELNKNFLDEMKISDTTSTLVVSIRVNVKGSSESFENDTENDYVATLNIPLTQRTVNINMSSSVADNESKVLANVQGLNQNIFKNSAIITAVILVIALAFFVFYVYSTRNEDINYSIKVNRLYKSYRSYIQKLTNSFDDSGYQILQLGAFIDMLTIRDTIMSPILMSENEDQTMTRFLIPTDTKVLYVYEIKVENYDEIYNNINKEDTNVDPIPVKVKERKRIEVKTAFLQPKSIKQKTIRNIVEMENSNDKK